MLEMQRERSLRRRKREWREGWRECLRIRLTPNADPEAPLCLFWFTRPYLLSAVGLTGRRFLNYVYIQNHDRCYYRYMHTIYTLKREPHNKMSESAHSLFCQLLFCRQGSATMRPGKYLSARLRRLRLLRKPCCGALNEHTWLKESIL